MSEDSGSLSNSNDYEQPEKIGENLPASFNGDDEELQEVIGENLPVSINGDEEEQHLVEDKELQGQCLRIVFLVSPARLYCCYAVIIVLTVAVVGLSVVLSLSAGKKEQTSIKNTYAACPRMWIGFGNKCFYFSEDLGNWTVSESYCRAQGSQLAQIDNQEELNVLNRFKGDSATWIGLHRESSEHPWMWTDSTDYNNLVPIRGDGNHAYLSDRGISSGRDYIRRRWICSKPTSYTLQCPGVSQLV